jgi:hypothetical protein
MARRENNKYPPASWECFQILTRNLILVKYLPRLVPLVRLGSLIRSAWLGHPNVRPRIAPRSRAGLVWKARCCSAELVRRGCVTAAWRSCCGMKLVRHGRAAPSDGILHQLLRVAACFDDDGVQEMCGRRQRAASFTGFVMLLSKLLL